MSVHARADVIVVGAGPAGSTAAALLAERGVRVRVLEKETFPRFHVGESLLPAAGVLEERLGVTPEPEAFLFKGGAQFVCEATGRVAAFDFAEALPGPPRHAWHVDRALYDTLLRDRAVAMGAEVQHGVRVDDVEVGDDRATVRTTHGRHEARFVFDATGLDRLMARRRRTVEPYRHFGKAAVFRQYEGVRDATFEEMGAANDIRIMIVPGGWGWVIPLPRRRLSIGLVKRDRGVSRGDLDAYVHGSPLLSRWTAGAEPGPVHIVGNYSFRNTRPYAPRIASIGDAACFIDPVFSSGVSLAAAGAQAAVERLVPALAEGREADPHLMAPVGEHMGVAYDTFASLVYRFYNTRFVDNLIFNAPTDGALRASVISVLGGDVFRDDSPFRDMLLASRSQPWRGEAPAGARRGVREGPVGR
ncbi:MAG: NAD(P)/FAD-dependent oxidoreductase [Myxococcota bacterium]